MTATKPSRGPISAGITLSGDVTASQQVNIAPKISGIITKLMVDVGARVTAGQEVAELDHAALDSAVTQAQAAVEVAKANQAKIAAQGRPEDVTKAQATLESAKAQLNQVQNTASLQAALDAARAKLSALQNGPRPEQVIVYQKAIDIAKNNLYSAQLTRDANCRSVGSAQCNASNASVDAMQTALDQANAQYQVNVAPPTSTDVAQAVDAVRQAQAAVDNSAQQISAQQAAVTSATAALKEAQQPYVATDFQTAQANVDSATAQLNTAKTNQLQAFVYAPFDGIISARLLSEGALASPSAPIFTIVSSNVEIDIPVAQEQINLIKDGQAAQLTTPAFANQTIDGKIQTIAPAADPKSRTFMVRVVPASQDGKLKAGMSAAITLITTEKPDVMLIPKDAVVVPQGTNKPGVYIIKTGPTGDIAVFTTPVFGVSNDKSTEVVSGLNPDDMVIIQGQASLINNQPVRIAGAGGPGPAPAGAAGTSGRPNGAQGGGTRPGGASVPAGASEQGRPGGQGRPPASGQASGGASASASSGASASGQPQAS